MKKKLRSAFCLLALVFFSIDIFSQVPSDCSVPLALQNAYYNDAVHLAFKRMRQIESPDTAQVFIPGRHIDTVLHGMAAIFNAFSIPERNSVFDIYCIHEWSVFYSEVYRTIILNVDTSQFWTHAWESLDTVTGYAELDNFLSRYGFRITYYSARFGSASLTTNQSLNVFPLLDSLEAMNGIRWAEPSSAFGSGDRIEYDKFGDDLFYNFSIGSGDCPSGCTSRVTWKFKVNYTTCTVYFLGIERWPVGDNSPLPRPRNCNITPGLPLTSNFSSNAPVCRSFPIDFYNLSLAYTSLLWNFGDGDTSTLTHPSHRFSSAGRYEVTLTASDGSSSSVYRDTVQVYPSPLPVIVKNNDTLCTQRFLTYNWYFNGQSISGVAARQQNYLPIHSGDYAVYVFDSNGCPGMSSVYNYQILDVAESYSDKVTILPNPVKDEVLFKNLPVGNFDAAIYNSLGQLVLYKNIVDNKVNLTDLKAGIYTVTLSNTKTRLGTYRLVKQ